MTDDRSFAQGSLQKALRALQAVCGDRALVPAGSGPTLERIAMRSEPPVVAPCRLLEPVGARLMPVAAEPLVVAFLDGVQRSRVVGYGSGTPLIFASVAAAVRERVARRFQTWREPRVHRALYASRAKLGEFVWQQLAHHEVPVVDITADLTDDAIPVHPFALRARALDLVALEREGLERRLAAQWCRDEARWLWIDGGIAGNLAVDEHATTFGVVKSHTTLYGNTAQVATVLSLAEAERSPAFLIGHQLRRSVVSWYLRLRTTSGGDPLHGLVRVEVSPPGVVLDAEPLPDQARARLTALCDRISAGMLAERAPLSLPDPRWDTLTYGIHACEGYLDALVGH